MTVLTFSLPLFIFLFLSLSALSRVHAIVSDTYALDIEYSGSTFFDGFDFFTGPDPTNGFVSYQSNTSSLSKSLISTSNNIVHMGVDHTTVLHADGRDGGRPSVRISSKKRFAHGLFLANVRHMPGNVCGVWPAYWMFGPYWPNSGEIDIIEGQSKHL
ncbi:concanavalin A-like lectin/glucanase domain-containing protein [Leptodontidium sp. 2 PMI_412]|nr:concanavalin A-like lectin/glucanase domain-containing protein [Leptodontidium sp. 2 PMI_412]